MDANLGCDKFWVNKTLYHDAEKKYYENLAKKKKQIKKRQKELQEKKNKSEKKSKKTRENEDKFPGGVGVAKIDQETFPKTSLAGEVAKARQHIKSSLECMESVNGIGNLTNPRLTAVLEKMEKAIENLTKRVEVLERECATCKKSCNPPVAVCPVKPQIPPATKPSAEKEAAAADDIDLFGSESEEEDEEAKKIREQRLAEYAAKKSKKPGPIAKSNIILDIKPWDDETDMKEMEKAVRAIEMDGLVWGASKLVPVAFKIFMLQISCVIEDEKVSVDLLTETLEGIDDYIQSVDIAAFNKV